MKKIIIFLLFLLALTSACVKAPDKIPEPEQKIEDKSLLQVKERGKLIVGSDVPYGSMEFYNEEGEIVGLDIDIIKEIAKRMEVELELIDIDWDDLFNLVVEKKLDLAISSITITIEREKIMLFSSPYLNSGQIILVRSDYSDISSAGDLNGRKVGVQRDTTCQEEAEKYVINPPLFFYDALETEKEGILFDLEKGKLDAVVVGYTAAIGLLRDNPDLKIVGEPLSNTFRGITTSHDNKALMDEVNRILREMKRDGMLKEIERKWMRPNNSSDESE